MINIPAAHRKEGRGISSVKSASICDFFSLIRGTLKTKTTNHSVVFSLKSRVSNYLPSSRISRILLISAISSNNPWLSSFAILSRKEVKLEI